jgi:hypothetical protein
VEFRSGRMGRGGGELAPERPVVVRIPLTARLGGFEAPGAEGPVFVHVPAGDHSGADHEVAEPGHTVGGVCFEGELQELVGFAAPAFPPIDEGDGGEDGAECLVLLCVYAWSSSCCAHSTRDHWGPPCVWARSTRSMGSSIPRMSAMSWSRIAGAWKLAISLMVWSSLG